MKGNYKNQMRMNSQCENAFSLNDKLEKHMLMHTRILFYKHSQCDKYFSNGNPGKNKLHFGDKTCLIHCGNAFPQNGNHINHLRTHWEEILL